MTIPTHVQVQVDDHLIRELPRFFGGRLAAFREVLQNAYRAGATHVHATIDGSVLIIEDEPHIVMGLRDALEFEGFGVISAGKGKDGIQLARADFLERVRRHSFLVTLGFAVFAAFMFLPPNPSKYATLNLGGHRGIYNSAWVGSLVAMLSVIFLSLAGFYLVKNAIERDRRTGVGQILAATPLPGPLYLLAKFISNLAVLAAMIAVLAVTAGVMQLVRGEDPRLDPAALLSPFLLLTLPSMAVVAALAVCFEVVPGLRGGAVLQRHQVRLALRLAVVLLAAGGRPGPLPDRPQLRHGAGRGPVCHVRLAPGPCLFRRGVRHAD